jgi:hypothetical protein
MRSGKIARKVREWIARMNRPTRKRAGRPWAGTSALSESNVAGLRRPLPTGQTCPWPPYEQLRIIRQEDAKLHAPSKSYPAHFSSPLTILAST